MVSKRIVERTKNGFTLERTGLSGREIAEKLGISVRTWKRNKKEVMKYMEENRLTHQIPVFEEIEAFALNYLPKIATLLYLSDENNQNKVQDFVFDVSSYIMNNKELSAIVASAIYFGKKYIIPFLLVEENRKLLSEISPIISLFNLPIAISIIVLLIITVFRKPLLKLWFSLLEFLNPDHWNDRINEFSQTQTSQGVSQQRQVEAQKKAQEKGNFWDWLTASSALSGTSTLGGAGGRS